MKDILKSDAELILIPVNCVGVMGAGLAKQFKEKFPHLYSQYRKLCESNAIDVGKEPVVLCGKWCMFPTKKHWKNPSKLEYIESGLKKLSETEYKTIAVPKLGCGCGGLNWNDVKQLVIKYLGRRAIIYA